MNDPFASISTCNSTNLFFIKDQQVWTSTGEFCRGITRNKAILICHRNGIVYNQTNFTFEDIKNCGSFCNWYTGIQFQKLKIEIYNLQIRFYRSKIRLLYNEHIQDSVSSK